MVSFSESSLGDVLEINTDNFGGGVGMWGAVPALYDTTDLPMDRGIHVHARIEDGDTKKEKQVDRTYQAVVVTNAHLGSQKVIVTEKEAIYFMAATAFGFTPLGLRCTSCGAPHLDEDWYCVHPHQEHQCTTCGSLFYSDHPATGNPVALVQQACGHSPHVVKHSLRSLRIEQAQFDGGLLVWGSNPAFLWTGDRFEQEGLHVHVFRQNQPKPVIDETFGKVEIDGVEVNPLSVRLLMAQSALPSLRGIVQSITCPRCTKKQFDYDADAFNPRQRRSCMECGLDLTEVRDGLCVIANPALDLFEKLESLAERPRQQHILDLQPHQPRSA